MKVILDTNFIMDLYRFRIDLEEIYDLVSEPVKLYFLSSALTELESLSKKAKHGRYAKLALKSVETNKIVILKTEGSVDETLLSMSKEFIVATNDRKLRERLNEKGVKTIYLRAKKHLAIG